MFADPPLWTLDHVNLGAGRLKDVTLKIHAGVTSVLGWSGAGKTSLLNVLVGYETPERGIFDAPPSMYWSPQTHGLWPHCTVRQHLDLVTCGTERAEALLGAFDLSEKADVRPALLSEGERSRLSVLRALAAPTKVLVMDEPLANVDPSRVHKYWGVIRRVLEADGRSLVFSTHLPEAALSESTQVICLRDGQVLHAGPTDEAYANPPNPAVMECFGPGNWITPEDARLWFNEEIDTARCFRPEQLAIEPAHISHVVVRESNFLGSMAEVELRHVSEAAVRRFLHRPSGPQLQAGAPASIRLRS